MVRWFRFLRRSMVFCICCSTSFCFGLHLEAEPVCKTVALAFSVKEATGKKCLLIYELGDMCSQFLSLSDYPCYEISFLKGCFRYIISWLILMLLFNQFVGSKLAGWCFSRKSVHFVNNTSQDKRVFKWRLFLNDDRRVLFLECGFFLLIGILDSVHNDIYAKEAADKLSRLVPGLFESFRNFILPLRFL